MKKLIDMRMLFTVFAIASVAFATTTGGGFENLTSALTTLCSGIKGVVPILSFLMIVAAGAVYAGGQMLGAETRARASVWATAMLVGAFIGLIIIVVTPTVLTSFYGSTGSGSFSC